VDGNLIAKADAGGVEIHWQGKIRGPDFPPMHFHLRSVTHERLKDSKGRLIPTVVASPLSEQAREDIANVTYSREDEMLVALLDPANRTVSKSKLARRLNWLVNTTGEPNHVQVTRVLKSLKADKLIKVNRGVIALTPEGKKQAEQVCSVRTDQNQRSSEPNKTEQVDE